MAVQHDEGVVMFERAPRPRRGSRHRDVERRFLNELDGPGGSDMGYDFSWHVTSCGFLVALRLRIWTQHHRCRSGRMCRQTAHFLRHQFAVRPLALHEAIRRAVFNDLAGLEHHHPVKIAQRCQSMGNRNYSATVH